MEYFISLWTLICYSLAPLVPLFRQELKKLVGYYIEQGFSNFIFITLWTKMYCKLAHRQNVSADMCPARRTNVLLPYLANKWTVFYNHKAGLIK